MALLTRKRACSVNPSDTKGFGTLVSEGLRFGVQHRPYFDNSGPNWSKLGSLVGKLILLFLVYFIFRKIENWG